MNEMNLCYGCMQPLGTENVCPHCGYDQSTPAQDEHLKPGTMLHERYLIGKSTASNGEGVTYLAYDCNIGCKVLVREYLPTQLCSRVPNSPLVNVSSEHLAQYKALMAEYTELNKALARMRNLSHLNPALDLFSENNTTYAVYEFLEGRTLLTYLKENAGELSWRTVRHIFPPLFTTLSLLHNAGVLHRGISTETIFVTDKGELKLSGFCISAVRTQDTELDAELFDGYAAPEQYFADRQQGTWTDVYGICAVLYRILTGCCPADAMSRQDYDSLLAPTDVNSHVPESVSDAVMRGLSLDTEERVRTITDLVTLLFGSHTDQKPETQEFSTESFHSLAPEHTRPHNVPHSAPQHTVSHTAPQHTETHTAPPHHTQHSKTEKRGDTGRVAVVTASEARGKAIQNEPSLWERIRMPLLIAVLFFAIVAIVIFALVQMMNSMRSDHGKYLDNSWSSMQDNIVMMTTTAQDSTVAYDSFMPNLIGMNFTIKKAEMAGWLELEPEYVYSEEYRKDLIIWQELEENAPFQSGTTVVKVRVSKGSSRIELPSFSGYRLETYLSKLEELGFVPATDGDMYSNHKPSSQSSAGESSTTTTTNSKQRVIYKSKVDYHYANGNVCAVTPDAGTFVDVLDDYEIIVYYANNPIVTTVTTTGGWTKPEDTGGTTVTTAKPATEAPSASESDTPPAASDVPVEPAQSGE